MQIHVVQEGESLNEIAERYGLTASYLTRINELINPNRLVVGQDIVILYPNLTHTVSEGDTIDSIIAEYGIDRRQLLRNNPALTVRDALYIGEVLIINFTEQIDNPVYPSETERTENEVRTRELSVIGYAYPFIERTLLRRTLPFITYLTIFTYGFNLDGTLIEPDDEELIALAREASVAPIMLISTLNAEGFFSNELARQLLTNPELQTTLINELIATMQRKNYYGIDIDFEYVPSELRENYVNFIAQLTAQSNEAGFIVLAALAPKTNADQRGLLYEAHSYPEIGAAANYVLLMTYEWGYTYGPPMAVAPINNVRRVLDYAVTEIPREKIFMGVPNYGYDWPLPYIRGATKATSLGNVEAVELALRYSTSILYDTESESPFFYYTDEQGNPHVVWFENARSIYAKLALPVEYELNGIGYWNIMRPFPQNWLVLNSLFNIRTLL